MKPHSNILIKKFLCVIAFATAGLIGSVNADVTIQQRGSWADLNAYTAVPTVAFDIVNTNSIFIATVYTDRDTPGLTDPRFGNNGGIGSGDVAPTLTIPGGRLTSYVFVNPSTSSGMAFRVNNPIAPAQAGTAIALYEIAGANTDTATFTTETSATTGATSITTTTAGEMVISFAGRNSAGNSSLTAGTIFSGINILSAGAIFGGGTINAADAIAPSIGAQNIAWTTNQAVGRIAFAFEAAPAVPAASPALTNFSYNAGNGMAAVSIKGAPGTRYKLVEADDLNFAAPDQDPIPLTGATVGTLDGDEVVADASGDATIQFNLGTSKTATFLRAVTIP